MDLPHRNIRFTTTEDGADIAFWEIGEGKPLVIIQNFGLSHAELEWSVPSLASFYMDMSERYRVIRFDPRGIGLSGEPPGGWDDRTESGAQRAMSIQHMGSDIEAVARALDLNKFALLGASVQSPVAIAYAATHPEVSELILCEGMASVEHSFMGPALRTQIDLDKLEEKTGAPVFSNFERLGPHEESAALAKVGYASQILGAWIIPTTQLEWDAERFLAEVSVPTLILVSRRHGPIEQIGPVGLIDTLPASRQLAAGIPDSRLVVLEGDERSFAPYWTDRAGTLAAIHAFLSPGAKTTMSATGRSTTSDFRTVVFTDIVGSTEYVRRVGDEAGRAAVRDLEEKIAALAADHGGRVVKNLGDGSLISFGSNSSAIGFALDVQDNSNDGPLKLRVGMAAGEPIQEDGDIHGTVVAHASRIGDLGDAGEVIVSDSVRQLAEGKGFSFESRGEVSLKGFDQPERVWRVTRS